MIEARNAAGLPPNPHGQELANVAIVMCAIAATLVMGRLLTRMLVYRSLGWDDFTLVGSMGLAIGMTVCYTKLVYYGMGLHTSELKNAGYKILAFEWLWISQLLYKFANGMTKISIVLLYLRIFPSRRFKIISWVFIGYVVTYCTAAIFTSIFQCNPIDKAWIKTKPGHCIDIGILWYVNSVNTLIADVILIALPINQIIRLKLPLSQRLGLVFVFSLGIFVMACTIIRCVALGPTVSQTDPVWYQATSNSWTFLEVDVSIICASLPVFKAPLVKLFPRLFGKELSTTARSRDYGSHGGHRIIGGHSIDLKNRDEWSPRSANRFEKNEQSDNASASDEERILSASEIRKTTNINVDYEEVNSMQSQHQREALKFPFGATLH